MHPGHRRARARCRLAEIAAAAPTRLFGLAGIDPTDITAGVERLERAVRELGFVGAHSYPHWFGLRPDDRAYYPFYAKCLEPDVPIQVQAACASSAIRTVIQIELPTEIGGRPLLRDGALGTWQGNSRQRPKRSVGRPDAFQRIAVDFPDLRLVGIHTGYPWERELVAAAWKHENLTIGADSHHPSRWSRDLVDFIASDGREQAVFGTNYPALGFGEFIGAIDELGFTDDVKRALLTENARRIYKLDV